MGTTRTIMRLFSAAIAVALFSLQPIHAAFTANCSNTPYELSKYTCFDGFLCPIINGETSLKCGNGCYLPEAYTCTNNTLTRRGPDQNAFGLVAINSGLPTINGQHVNACGSHFYIGIVTCQFCPESVAPTGICNNVTNTTLVYGNSAMDVAVPGGQQYYIDVEHDGAMGYTQPHSALVPPGADVGNFAAAEAGYFEYAKSYGWLACPQATTQPNATVYQLFAQLPNTNYNQSCVGLNIITQDAKKGQYGAWEYT